MDSFMLTFGVILLIGADIQHYRQSGFDLCYCQFHGL